MARDEQVALDDYKEELLDKELEVFMEHALQGGNRVSSTSWFD